MASRELHKSIGEKYAYNELRSQTGKEIDSGILQT